MSGIDEQERDFPPCSNCDRFSYWITRGKNRRLNGLCLNPDSYLDIFSLTSKVNGCQGRNLNNNDIESIEVIECNACGYHVPNNQMPLFIKLIKMYMHTGNKKSRDIYKKRDL